MQKNLKPKPFPIVGFGASAGGIEAFTTVLQNLDVDLGMAYVLIMHLSRNHKSALARIMQTKTSMPVQTVKNGMEVMANNVYVIPPNTCMSLVDGHLKLAPRSQTSKGNFAVDYFLTALASIYKTNAIGVILSGTASDGTLGLKAVKACGGITFAQDGSAEFSGMPHNAFDSGYVDLRLSPEGIAKELARLSKVSHALLPVDEMALDKHEEIIEQPDELKSILAVVRAKWGIDFFLHYKQASIYRRVIRRVVLNNFTALKDYRAMLERDDREVDSLYNDFLINVTSFFRDPDFFKTLHDRVFPSLVKDRKAVDPIRIWVAGCATGEEAYSIVISLLEFLEEENAGMPIKIFASDLDAKAIEIARFGTYPVSALLGVSAAHLKKYFKKVDDQYQINKSVREVCTFSQHNLLRDPPFSRIDLISCQNVLIYLETIPQKRILQAFHYGLKSTGYLFLGKSETIGNSQDLFEAQDKRVRCYSRKQTKSPQLDFSIPIPGSIVARTNPSIEQNVTHEVEKDMVKFMLSNFVHPGVVVDKNLLIIQFFGPTAPYLQPVTGKASFNILKMIREELILDLRSLLQQVRKNGKAASKDGIRLYQNKILQEISLEVVPRKIDDQLYFLVVFVEKGFQHEQATVKRKARSGNDRKEKTIIKLEEELIESREVIRTTNEEYETTYEQLQANNEEILSSNEELQSVNEELETSKEELQSSNEELMTTNEELRRRNVELGVSHKELKILNEQLEQYAYISSHDLQEPLRKISLFSNLLSGEEAHLNEYAKKYAAKINTSSARMSTLLKDLLSFALVIKQDKRKHVSVDLNAILKNVISDLEVSIESKKAEIKIDALPTISAEPIQMNQLFHNLIGNALKFSKDNPVISILTRNVNRKDFVKYPQLDKQKQYVAISVKDNGLGFDQKYAEQMFTLFQRLHIIEGLEGTGLGLAICKKIMDNHDGVISAEGRVGVGSVFTLFLAAPNGLKEV